MFPDQIRQAIDKNVPAVMAIGVMEYHSEHCCVGVDFDLYDDPWLPQLEHTLQRFPNLMNGFCIKKLLTPITSFREVCV
jgi:hypothetical protein